MSTSQPSARTPRALLLLALSIACSEPERQARQETPRPERRRDGGTLVRRLEEDLRSVTPVCTTGSNDALVHQYLYTPLVYFDRDLRVIPGLATSWETLDEGRRYRFVLNPGATFTDKTPVRASDVLFTLKRLRTSAAHIAGSFAHLDETRTRVIDDHRLDIAFTHELATQLSRFADVYVIPEHAYEDTDVCATDKAIGSGPFILVARRRGKSLTLERRADYWGTRPHIQRIVFSVITEHKQAWHALTKNELDETRVTSTIWQHERTNAAHARRMAFLPYYKPGYNYLAWNANHHALEDVRVRRALAHAIPVDAIIHELYQGTARRLSGPFTPDEDAYNTAVVPITYDPREARRLLASAGWQEQDGVMTRDGVRLAFTLLLAGEHNTVVAQALQDAWRRIGVLCDLDLTDVTTANERLRTRNYDAAYWGWTLDAEPDLYTIFHSSQLPPHGLNFVAYQNPQADRLIEQARVERDAAKRRELHWQLHALLARDQPYTWLVQTGTKWVVNKRVRGMELSPRIGPFLWYPGELAWWIAEDAAP